MKALHPHWFAVGLTALALLQAPVLHAADNDLQSLTEPESNDWQLVRKDQRHNIVIYNKREDGRPIRSVKAEGTYESSFDAAARHQLDIDNYKNWYMNMGESRLLKKVSDTEFYMYFMIKAPIGIVPSRDAVVHVRIEPYSAASGSLVIRYNAVPDWAPRKPGLVRMPLYEITTRITPLGPMKTREVTEGYVSPGGVIPAWLINYLQRQIPYNNLLGRNRDIPNYEGLQSPSEFRYKE